MKMIEGDNLHAAQNIEKTSRGIPLADDDRFPWLDRIALALSESRHEGTLPPIAMCSALRRIYRDQIKRVSGMAVCYIFLDGNKETIAKQMSKRTGHFMPTSMIESQFATLERPQDDGFFIGVDVNSDRDHAMAKLFQDLSRLISP